MITAAVYSSWEIFLLGFCNYIIGFAVGRWITLRHLKEAVDKVKKEMQEEFDQLSRPSPFPPPPWEPR